jgi:hypothetical protein
MSQGGIVLSSGIFDLAIGLAFIFGVTAALCSVITELISRFLGLRGAYLLLGLRELLDSSTTPVVLGQAKNDFAKVRDIVNTVQEPPEVKVTRPVTGVAGTGVAGTSRAGTGTAGSASADLEAQPASATSALLGSPILSSQGMTGQIASRSLTLKAAKPGSSKASLPTGGLGLRRSLPSYIPAQSFAEAIIDMVIPDKSGQTNMGVIQHYLGQLPDSMGPLKGSLQSLATNAGDDVGRFRTSVEQWYDNHMDRVSGWYKRRAALITTLAGAILVLLLNINTITIGHALYGDSAVRSAVSTAAAQNRQCPSTETEANCLSQLETEVSSAAQAGLPIGWGTVPACAEKGIRCGWLAQRGITNPKGGSPWQVILVLLGFLLTIAALTPGAQFWFGLLVKLNSLRASGPPPAAPAASGPRAR